VIFNDDDFAWISSSDRQQDGRGMVLSPSGRVNKSLDNKEETTYKRAKEKEA
jgi:hypothetical protein